MMKNIIHIREITLILCALLLLTGTSLWAQKTISLGYFGASEKNGEVVLSWSIEKGNTCNGISIHRSTDQINFDKIGDLFGVCGSSSKTLYYSFIDEQPEENKTNYYHLRFGSIESSKIITLDIINIKNKNYSIRPHPIINNGKIYFKPSNNKAHQLSVYDLNGKKILHALSEGESFDINLSNFGSGLYLFTISTEAGLILTNGKIITRK